MTPIVRLTALVAGLFLTFVVLIAAAATAVVGTVTSPLDDLWNAVTGTSSSPRPDADGEIPTGMYTLYHQAAAYCPGLPWTVLAGIGKVETDHGRARNQVSPAGAVGPMQFMTPTFTEYALPVPPDGTNPASPWDPVDAVFAAARILCHNGAAAGRNLPGAVFSYNHDLGYVARVLELSDAYTHAAGGLLADAAHRAPSRAARIALDYAAAQVGLPYIWGGNGPDRGDDKGFDCSGLTQSAYQAAGITIPRTATAQFSTGRKVEKNSLQPGDLVFYGNPGGFLHHVAMYVGNGQVLDAPHTGASIRLDPVDASDYAGAVREG